MAKRQAEEPLEDIVACDSPASKKARVEESAAEGGVVRTSTNAPATNGHHRPEDDERAGNDILAAADREEEELEEAAVQEAPPDDDDAADIDQDQPAIRAPARQTAPAEGYTDLYLDTINRAVLDFDFEKLCSVSLSNINVYACLVCGRYYQGRGPKSHAYFHALEVGHHVFVNMETKKVYVLPEGYEVKSKSLEDIKFVVDPRYSKEEVAKLDKEPKTAWDLSGKKYTPGFVGMNNIKANDYLNVIVHALAHVPPLRNFLMLSPQATSTELISRFSILIRKIWNPRAFKSHVSPHELLQEISLRSNKRFNLTTQSDPVDFLSWFLNNLHLALGGSKTKPQSSIIQKIFQGKLKVEAQLITPKADASGDRLRFEESAEVKTTSHPFLLLTLDLPPAPLFQDELDRNIIPQVPLTTILAKYNGTTAQEHLQMRKRHRLLHPLPPYLLFHIKRFSQNKFVAERNPTIVTFSPRSLDMAPYVEPNPAIASPSDPIWYDLVANVTHEAVRKGSSSNSSGASDKKASGAGAAAAAAAVGGSVGGPIGGDSSGVVAAAGGGEEAKMWRVQVRDRSRGEDEWFEVQDLWVERVSAETLFTKESYLQVWERRREPKKKATTTTTTTTT
ncbi:MAG: hypothetical protein M1819_002250 [Sarea resinae]|nr:MAG: hypothetical protein M1819_002250 [Sarea resinae]